MQISILVYFLIWWLNLTILGLVFLPLTFILFKKFKDGGYIFSKIIGIGILSYSVFIISLLKVFPFSFYSIFFFLSIFLAINLYLVKRFSLFKELIKIYNWMIFEEILFLFSLITWAYIRSFSPEINGLEKFMDFGFINSILRSSYFPPKDIWFPPFAINYYYFGHLYTAVLTKMSFIPSQITYNLSIATLFALTLTSSFSIGLNVIKTNKIKIKVGNGLLSALLVTLGGNLHTIYSLFKDYNVENVLPFWRLNFSINTFPNNYWYPNATRFIPFTIHEFPLYSFVVSDLHGHVLDIPFVLLTIALILSLFEYKDISIKRVVFICLFLSLMYMTNAWDGGIYLLLLLISVFILIFKSRKKIRNLANSYVRFLSIIFFSFVIFILPFSINFKPFVSGIGILCSPSFLTQIKQLGPFLFEANHCQSSPVWQLVILYGFFYFWAIVLLVYWWLKKFKNLNAFILILIFFSTLLILLPEFIYFKDIYPQHYRANTMFKLVYQAFILLSIVSSYSITTVLTTKLKILFAILTIPLLSLVFIYPKFAIDSYYKSLKGRMSLDGINYISQKYPEDYDVIRWIDKNINGQPTILEAQGDSYTDYERLSANTGLPTVLGWTVHEWLWRGEYSIPAPRIKDIEIIYESENLVEVKKLLKKYQIEYVYVGVLEMEKYKNIKVNKFEKIGSIVFRSGKSNLFKINSY